MMYIHIWDDRRLALDFLDLDLSDLSAQDHTTDNNYSPHHTENPTAPLPTTIHNEFPASRQTAATIKTAIPGFERPNFSLVSGS